MVRVSLNNSDFFFKDGDVLGSEGTVEPKFFARFEGIRAQHVVFSESANESFLLIPEDVGSVVRLDGERIVRGVKQRITGRHSLILNEVGMLIERLATDDSLGPNSETVEDETVEEVETAETQALGTDLGLLELIVENIDDLIAVI